jgi:hypothetical protein
MGHIAPKAARGLIKDGHVTGINLDHNSGIESCESCVYMKMTRTSVPKERQGGRAKAFGDKIHSDIWGPSPIKTLGGKSYYSTFTDDHTSETHTHLMVHKSDTFDSYRKFEAWAETQMDSHIKVLQSD